MRLRSTLVFSALCGSLTSCLTPPAPLQPREWLEVSAGASIVDARTFEPVDDALGLRIGGGYDFNSDPLRLSWEADAVWARHEVDAPAIANQRLSTFTVGTGLRLTADFEPLPLRLYGRGGGAWRNETADDGLVQTRDGVGYYYGVGLEFAYSAAGALGPSATWFRDDERDIESAFFGLSARFQF